MSTLGLQGERRKAEGKLPGSFLGARTEERALDLSETWARALNEEKIYSEVLRGAPFLKNVVQAFVESLPSRISELQKALNERRFEELAILSHRLKGAGGTHGYPTLTEKATFLQKAAKQRDAEEAQRLLEEIKSIASRLVAEPPPQ